MHTFPSEKNSDVKSPLWVWQVFVTTRPLAYLFSSVFHGKVLHLKSEDAISALRTVIIL